MTHCSDCNICVEGYDHHCGVVGTCIGDPNMKYFIQFMIYSALDLIFVNFTYLYVETTEYEAGRPSIINTFATEPIGAFLTCMGSVFGFSLLFTGCNFLSQAINPQPSYMERNYHENQVLKYDENPNFSRDLIIDNRLNRNQNLLRIFKTKTYGFCAFIFPTS